MALEEEVKQRLDELLRKREILKALQKLARAGQKSLVIEFQKLLEFDINLAKALLENPLGFLDAADQILAEITKLPGMHLRVKGLDQSIAIRDIRAEHIGRFIQVEGILTRASEVKPEIREAVFKCLRCGELNRVLQIGEVYREPLVCENPNCSRRGPFKLEVESSEFRDWQSIRIQERPEELRGGRMPRQLDGIIKDDFVDLAVPGNHVVITGVLRVFQEGQPKQRKTTFRKILFVNHIEVLQKGAEEAELRPEDEERIKELSKDPKLRELIIQSIAPSIYGYEPIKEAIALMLFGSPSIELPDGTRRRGDTHILLTGDPGTAKSEILKWVALAAPRGIYTSGKKATGAGLTAAAVRDEIGGGWTLEAGALVIADGGLACLHPKSKVIVNNRITPIERLFNKHQEFRAMSNGEEIEISPLDVEVVYFNGAKMGTTKSTLIRRKFYQGPMLEIITEAGSKLRLTPDHKLLDGNSLEWKVAAEFKPLDYLLSKDCIQDQIKTIRNFDYSGYVYDLFVPIYHNFLCDGVVVHNCIDEFDKMSAEDASAILESMEQQTISVAKAGIVATLNTRTSVLAAANPRLGRFDKYKPLAEQIDIPPIILSRFDLIFIMRDEPLAERDRAIAHHILELHREPTRKVKPPLDIEDLRKIVIYARKHIHPKFEGSEPLKVIEDFFVQWRRVAEKGEMPIPVTARQLEALVRLSRANARMRLSNRITTEDANRAIKLLKLSLQEAGIDPETGRVDIDVLMTGRSKSQREKFERVMEIIRELEEEYGGVAPINEVKRVAESEGIKPSFVEELIDNEKMRGHLFEPKPGMISRAVKW